jgi:hypothetical protein
MGAGIIIFIVLLFVLIVGGIFAYMRKLFWFQKSDRKYTTVYSSGTVKGPCSNPATDGTAGAAVTKSSECAAACDDVKAPAVCNGYDWDGTSGCTLYATLPTAATAPPKGDKNECRALSK